MSLFLKISFATCLISLSVWAKSPIPAIKVALLNSSFCPQKMPKIKNVEVFNEVPIPQDVAIRSPCDDWPKKRENLEGAHFLRHLLDSLKKSKLKAKVEIYPMRIYALDGGLEEKYWITAKTAISNLDPHMFVIPPLKNSKVKLPKFFKSQRGVNAKTLTSFLEGCENLIVRKEILPHCYKVLKGDSSLVVKLK